MLTSTHLESGEYHMFFSEHHELFCIFSITFNNGNGRIGLEKNGFKFYVDEG